MPGVRRRRCGDVLLLCTAAMLAISGCTSSPIDWNKPGMTSAGLRRDLADCERKATGPGPFHFEALGEDYETARDQVTIERNRCMKDRGWQPSRKNGATP